MKFKEVEISSINPFQSEKEEGLFLYAAANVSDYAVRVTKEGAVVEENETTVENFFAPCYLFGWKWYIDILQNVARGRSYPEREFVDFIFDMSIKLGTVQISKEKAMEEFEKQMKTIWKHPDTFKIAATSGEYVSNVIHAAFEAWCAARNYPKFPIRKVEG